MYNKKTKAEKTKIVFMLMTLGHNKKQVKKK